MLINIDKYKLKTYSIDCICIQKANDTLCSSYNIRTCLEFLSRSGFKGMKNDVEEVLKDFSTIDMELIPNSFETKNYMIKHDSKINYEVRDKHNKNNVRWIQKVNLLHKLYLLEINRLNATTIQELVAEIEQLNKDFTTIIGQQ